MKAYAGGTWEVTGVGFTAGWRKLSVEVDETDLARTCQELGLDYDEIGRHLRTGEAFRVLSLDADRLLLAEASRAGVASPEAAKEAKKVFTEQAARVLAAAKERADNDRNGATPTPAPSPEEVDA